VTLLRHHPFFQYRLCYCHTHFFAKIVCLQYIDIQLSGIYSNGIFDMKKAHRYRIDMPSENMTTKRNN